MKQILLIIAALVLLTACKSSKDYLSRGDEDKTLFDIVKKLNKHSNDENAVKALPEVYSKVQQNHLGKITVYKTNKDISHWDKLVEEYSTLQNMYDAIGNSDASSRLVNATNYQNELDEATKNAAAAYYELADELLHKGRKEDSKKAYTYFKKSDKFIPGFRNTKSKMDEAYLDAIINVVIDPVLDNSFFLNTGWGNNGYNYSNDYFQQTLIRDLGGIYASRYPAKFYSERDARREIIQADWVIDLTLKNLDVPQPKIYSENRNVSGSVESGKDTSGRPMYQNVYATVNTTTKKYSSLCQMELTITDIKNRREILHNTYTEEYNWQEISYSYSGDNRAFSSSEFEKIKGNDTINQQFRKEDILKELYSKIYPKVKSRIISAVSW